MYFYEIRQEATTVIRAAFGEIAWDIEDITVDELMKSKSRFIDDLVKVSKMIKAHRNHVAQYVKCFGQSNDPRCQRYAFYCLVHIDNTLSLLAKKITEEKIEEIEVNIINAYFIWEEKYCEDFEIWMYKLMNSGLHITKDVIVFAEKEQHDPAKRMIMNALMAERLFFSLERSQNKSVRRLAHRFFGNRVRQGGVAPVIDVNRHTGRGLITAATGAVAKAIKDARPEQLATAATIPVATGWHVPQPSNGNREKVIRGMITRPRAGQKDIEINYQHHPVPGDLANLMTAGVGTYAEIAKFFTELTNNKPALEQKLANLLLDYKHGDSEALSVKYLFDVKLYGCKLYLPTTSTEQNQIITRLNRIAYLICFQEVWRRKNPGYRQAKGDAINKVPELPFGAALACALKLIADGHVRLLEVFSENALLGVFTGQSVMKDNILTTVIKFNVIFAKFVAIYASQSKEVLDIDNSDGELNFAFTPEFFHKLFKESDGGSSDSDDEEYSDRDEPHEDQEVIDTLISKANAVRLTPPRS
jgi:hypothetical protein